MYHCPLFDIVFKVHHVGYVGSLTHFLTSFIFSTIRWKWLFSNNYHIANWWFSFHDLQSPHYGALWIDSCIFFPKVLIECPFKGFPITLWKLLLKLVITMKLYSDEHFFPPLLHNVMPTHSFTTTCNVFLIFFVNILFVFISFHIVCICFAPNTFSVWPLFMLKVNLN